MLALDHWYPPYIEATDAQMQTVFSSITLIASIWMAFYLVVMMTTKVATLFNEENLFRKAVGETLHYAAFIPFMGVRRKIAAKGAQKALLPWFSSPITEELIESSSLSLDELPEACSWSAAKITTDQVIDSREELVRFTAIDVLQSRLVPDGYRVIANDMWSRKASHQPGLVQFTKAQSIGVDSFLGVMVHPDEVIDHRLVLPAIQCIDAAEQLTASFRPVQISGPINFQRVSELHDRFDEACSILSVVRQYLHHDEIPEEKEQISAWAMSVVSEAEDAMTRQSAVAAS